MRKLLPLLLAFALLLPLTVTAQELDEFTYLPIIFKSGSSPPPLDCNSYEPNDTSSQANWIQDGETQTQCIIPETDVDWVKFSVSTKSKVVLEAADQGGDLELDMYDSTLNHVGGSYSYPDSPARIDRDCGIWGDPLPAGVYYGRVEHWLNFEEIPSYEIKLTVAPCPTPVILPNHSYYTTSYALYVVGEVQNNGEIGISGIEVIANLFNGNDQLIDTGTDSVWLGLLPGEKTCFDLGFSEWNGWSYFEFETPTYERTSEYSLQNIIVYDDHGTYNPDNGSYRILGFVRNDNDSRAVYVEVLATLYDASGIVVGCGSSLVNSTNLDPGQSSSFELTFGGYYRDYADVASYRIQINGGLQ